MRGSRGMCVGSGEWTISSIENSTYAHNKITFKKKISVPPPAARKNKFIPSPKRNILDPRMLSIFSSRLLKFFSCSTEGSWTGGLWSNRKDNEHHSCIWRSRVYSHQQEIFPTIPNGWSRQENTTNCKLSIRTYIHVHVQP